MVTSPRNQNCRGRFGESAWGEWKCVGGGQGSCGKMCWGRCREMRWGVGEVRKDVWGVEKSGRVYEVSGEGCEGVYGERKCNGMWGKGSG